MNKSKIDWCDMSWNPVTGCLHGCSYCYARRIANRFGTNLDRNGITTVELHYKRDNPYPYNFYPTFHMYRLDEPKNKTKGKTIFVCSMADLFGEWVHESWIEQIFNSCEEAPQHRYIFLTKNPKRYKESVPQWKSYHGKFQNMWFGTTITGNNDIQKSFDLLNSTSKTVNKFLSIEPLLGEIDLNKNELLLSDYKNKATIGNYIDWVIVGGQTGQEAVPPKHEWIKKIIDQCRESGVPIFLKDNLNWHEEIKEFPW